MNITEDFITQFAGSASTVSNGKSLQKKKSFGPIYQSKDQTLIFGDCKGSGKNPYRCSVDFLDSEKPVPRCNCPSRQFPCKHVIGLLYCFLYQEPFEEAEIPEDIISKRSKIQQKEEKKEKILQEATPKKMTKAKATAAMKKCNAQLTGIELAKKILDNIVSAGLHSLDKANEKLYLGQVKELGNYYISGIQAALTNLLIAAAAAQKEQNFMAAVDQVHYLYALLKKSEAHTKNKIADYTAFPEMTEISKEARLSSFIEEQMGYAWKLSELKEEGLVQENVQLLQVGFDCYEDQAKKQWVDEGIWISLLTGQIFKTYTYRPFKAQKYIREEDSFFSVLMTSELYVYPGERNPRVRWEKSDHREVTPRDLQQARVFARKNYSEVIREVKGQIKNPLADKKPVYALQVSRLCGNDEGVLAVVDEHNVSVPLRLEAFGYLLKSMGEGQVNGGTMICRFGQDLNESLLQAVPIALINDETIIRFLY